MSNATVVELVRQLIKNGVYLYVEDAALKYKANKGALSKEDFNHVRQYKTEIIAYLQSLESDSKATLQLPSITPRQAGAALPLSYAQQRLWFVDQLGQGSIQYNTQSRFMLEGELNQSAFTQALKSLLQRHEILRSCFVEVDSIPTQKIRVDYDLPLKCVDLIAVEAKQKSQAVAQVEQQQVEQVFDLTADLMLSVVLVKVSEDKTLVINTVHHIIGDGWSIGIFNSELKALYTANCQGVQAQLRPLEIQYGDYAIWQRQWLSEEKLTAQLDYWQQQLKGIPQCHNLSLDNPRPARQTFAGHCFTRQLNQPTANALLQVCKDEQVTIFMLLQTAFALLLSRYSNESDIVMGAAVAGREQAELENLIGLFLNVLVLRSDMSNNTASKLTFRDLLARNKQMILAAFEHQNAPFEMVVERLSPERNLSHNALVQVLFGVQNNQRSLSQHELDALNQSNTGQSVDLGPMSTRFDIKLDVYQFGDVIKFAWLYDTNIFSNDTIEAMAENFEALLVAVNQQMSQTPALNQDIANLNIVSLEQTQQLHQLGTIDAGRAEFDLVHRMIEAQVGQHGDEIAIMDDDTELSFNQFNQAANQLALLLIDNGVGAETFVGVSLPRSVQMVVALFAVLKAGGAYVPLDPALPQERLKYMLGDSGTRLILTDSTTVSSLPKIDGHYLCIDDEDIKQQLAQHAKQNLNTVHAHPAQLAYMIYTSGSTGKPKGVAVSHANVCDFLHHSVESFLPEHVSGAIVSSPLVFDATVGSLWVPLCAGRYCELLPEGVFALERLADALADDEDGLLFKLTPSHLEAVHDSGFMQPSKAARHVLVVAGEPLKPNLLSLWTERYLSSSQFINEYGPTETTVGATIFDTQGVSGDLSRYNSVPVGGCFGDTQLYVLDQNAQLLPKGVIGELYIGGAGVARGYYNRGDLTAEKFVPCPFGKSGERLYRTGDLVRLVSDSNMPGGTIEFIGRVDHQVKIRGFRIELGEIESQLLQTNEIKEAIVMAQSDSDNGKSLAAYLVVSSDSLNDEAALVAQLKAQMQQLLPSYMVPQKYYFYQQFPLTPNGKVDRNTLLSGDNEVIEKQTYVAPKTELQHALVEIWQTLLKRERIGINDNFFALGGHSLLATRLVSSVRQQLDLPLTISALFETPTISALAEKLSDNSVSHAALPTLTQRDNLTELPLSFAQQRLWFIDRLGEGSVQYNMPGAFFIEGSFDLSAFKQAFAALLNRHQVLTTRFSSTGEQGNVTLALQTDYALPITLIDLSDVPTADVKSQLQNLARDEGEREFDLGQDLMMRVCVFKLADNKHLVQYTLHHIACDGWSMGIIKKELSAFYAAFVADKPDPLAPLAIQYADYAHWQQQWMNSEVMAGQLAYWQKQLADLPAVHQLPLDKPRPLKQTFNGQTISQLIDQATSDQIKQLAQQHDASTFMVLQSAFALLLRLWGGQNDIVMGVPIAGRTESACEPLVGLFLNSLVLRSELANELCFDDLLAKNKTMILNAYEHQHVPFEKLVEVLRPERRMAYSPLFQVWFSLQNNEKVDMDIVDAKASGVNLSGGLSEELGHHAKYELNLYITETEQGLYCTWRYNVDLFKAETITYLAEQFNCLLSQICNKPKDNILSFDVFDADILQQPLNARAAPVVDEDQQDIVARFKQCVAQNPQSIAVVDGQKQYSYQQLDEVSDVYGALIAKQCDKERVALLFGHSCDMAAAIIGALKAGKVYVPLDAQYPVERLELIVEDADVALVVASSDHQDLGQTLSNKSTAKVCVADEQQLSSGERLQHYQHHPLAYILYTSGSTGRPKGVYQSRRNVAHLIGCYRQSIDLTDKDRVLQLASFNFDAAVMDFYGALLSGASLYLVDVKSLDSETIINYLLTHQISVYHSTPTVLKHLHDSADKTLLSAVRAVVLGGERVDSATVNAYLARFEPHCKLVNGFGPTESTLALQKHCSYQQIQSGEPAGIGFVIPGSQVRIIKGDGDFAKVFESGEIVIESEYVALGYWGLEQLTRERFVPQNNGTRRYFTGDQGRFLADGSVEYLGRNDNQIKIRGIRVELGDIEHQLLELNVVKEAVVKNCSSGDGQVVLAAFVIADDSARGLDDAVLAGSLKAQLRSCLPEYMVPQSYTMLPSYPLTPSGKVDRGALIAPAIEIDETEYLAPITENQQWLCQCWQQLLDVDRVGLNDNFFELGGHSLLAVRLISQIRQKLTLELPLKVIFAAPTVKLLSEQLIDKESVTKLSDIQPVDQSVELTLSTAQKRLWFIDHLEGPSSQFNLPGQYLVSGDYNCDAFAKALNCIIERHQVLRVVFSEQDGQPKGHLLDTFSLPLRHYDLSQFNDTQTTTEVENIISEQAFAPFDLTKDLMLRVAVVSVSEQQHLILYTLHHIASDGWSRSIFKRELSSLYQAFCQAKPNPLPALEIQYSDYARWQQSHLKGEAVDGAMQYWQQKLAEMPLLHNVPLDKPRPKRQRFVGKSAILSLSKAKAQNIKTFTQTYKVTLSMLMHTAFSLLLCRYSGEKDIAVGSSYAGRDHHQSEGLIGFFVNDLVYRLNYQDQPTFAALLQQHKQTLLDAQSHQQLPFEMLVEQLNPSRSLAHGPLFQIKLDVQNNEQNQLQLQGLTAQQNANTTGFDGVRVLDIEHVIKHDLYVSVTEGDQGIEMAWRFAVDLFEDKTIASMAENFEHLLMQVVENPLCNVDSYPLVTDGQKQQQLVAHQGEQMAKIPACLHQLFEQQALLNPDAPAVIDPKLIGDGGVLTFAELNQKANQLAHYLVKQGVKPNTIVPLLFIRSTEMVIAMLAVLKAGGAYAPIEPDLPVSRIEDIFKQIESPLVLTHNLANESLKGLTDDIVCYESIALGNYSDENIVIKSEGSSDEDSSDKNLAYVIFTSGSTGVPKGVMVEHRGLVNYCRFGLTHYYSNQLSGALVATSYSFDLTAPCIYLPLLSGGCVHLAPANHEMTHLASVLPTTDKAYLLRLTPSHIEGILALMDGCVSDSEHVFVIGGEALSWTTTAQLKAVFPRATLYNHYGPSEAIIGCSLFEIPAVDSERSGQCPIGKAMADTQLLVLNSEGQLCPDGVVGELYIGGDSLARGYLNQTELTTAKFIDNPYGSGRLYRSGDLVRYQSDGQLRFVGRVDDLVKVRGMRIELGEIEQQLNKLADVKQAAVMAQIGSDGTELLIGYVVLEQTELQQYHQNKANWTKQWQQALKLKLPDYMVPSVFMGLAALPLNANGKLNRKQLPKPTIEDRVLNVYVAPVDEVQQQLCDIWQNLLNVDRVGIEDDFFQLGGHSLSATRVVSAIRQTFAVEIALRTLFEKTTIMTLSAQIKAEIYHKQAIENQQRLAQSDDFDEVIL